MEDIVNYKDEFDRSFDKLKTLIDESFGIINGNPDQKAFVIDLWQSHITQFMSHTFKASEKYGNKDIFKAITKTMIFGK